MQLKKINILLLLLLIDCKYVNYQSSIPTNSYSKELKKYNINYFYDEDNKTHDYSKNWDLDGDNLPDIIKFIGNDAVNIRYILFVELSSNLKKYSFSSYHLNNPMFEKVNSLKETNNSGFTVIDFNDDGINDLIIKIDTQYSELDSSFSKVGISFSKKKENFIISKIKP